MERIGDEKGLEREDNECREIGYGRIKMKSSMKECKGEESKDVEGKRKMKTK